MYVQKTDWGQITWYFVPDAKSHNQVMNVGVTEVGPGLSLPDHVHYANEQFLYILNGEGYYVIDGVKRDFHKGEFFHMAPDAAHMTVNTGTEPVRELLVSIPARYDQLMDFPRRSPARPLSHNSLYSAVEAIQLQLLGTQIFPITILDDTWSLVWQNDFFPPFCVNHCDPRGSPVGCACLCHEGAAECAEPGDGSFVCPRGLTVFHFPVVYEKKRLGTIRGGHVLVTQNSAIDPLELYDTPQSTITGMQDTLRHIVKSILSFCEFDSVRQELEDKSLQAFRTEQDKRRLQQHLGACMGSVANVRINRHFLFNTLTAIASMALVGERQEVYEAVVDLAKMFRYTMTTNLQFVQLSSELDNLRIYLKMQQLRHRGDLEVNFSVPENLGAAMVPFNFLQPVVENAFTHGFPKSEPPHRLDFSAQGSRRTGRVAFVVTNNGNAPDEVTLNRVLQGVQSNTGHGLGLVYAKLATLYGQNFSFHMEVTGEGETRVVIEIPFVSSGGDS